MTFGYRGRASRRRASTLTIPIAAIRALRDADVLADAEFRQTRAGIEYRIPGADWRPIEAAANPRSVQLAALGAGEENR